MHLRNNLSDLKGEPLRVFAAYKRHLRNRGHENKYITMCVDEKRHFMLKYKSSSSKRKESI